MAEGMATPPTIAAPPLQTARHGRGRRLIEAIEDWLEAERDQLPLWLPVFLAAGVGAWFSLPDRSAWTAAVIAALALSAIGLSFAPSRRIGRALAVAGVTMTLGLSLTWLRSESVAAPRLSHPVVATFDARVDGMAPLPEGAMRLTLSADGQDRVQGCHRVLKDHADLRPADMPNFILGHPK